jgi:hypothetical protein
MREIQMHTHRCIQTYVEIDMHARAYVARTREHIDIVHSWTKKTKNHLNYEPVHAGIEDRSVLVVYTSNTWTIYMYVFGVCLNICI